MKKLDASNNGHELKSLSDESHNAHDNLIALVKFLARHAAEEDFKNFAAQINQTNEGEKQ